MATKPKSTPSKRKPLPRGKRSTVLRDSGSLLAHTSQFATGASAVLLADKVCEYVKLYDEMAIDYDNRPSKGRGAPRKDEYTVLVSSLATALALVTGKPSTRNYDEQRPSLFGRFVEPILQDLGIGQVKWLVKKQIKLRDTPPG